MKANFKFRIYPNKSQKRELFRQFAKHCELYNFCRNERIETYEKTKKSPSGIDQVKANVPKFKDKTNVSSLQQTVRRVDKAFQSFFRRVKTGQTPGFPRYKKTLDSIDFSAGDGAKIKGERLYIQHVGNVKIILHRKLPKHSRITVKYQSGQFFASFMVDAPIKTLIPSPKTIGLDFGLKTFISTTDGEKIESPKFLKKSLKRLKRAASRRDKCEKGSLERRGKSRVMRNIHRKISNQRSDFNHKLSNRLVEENGSIAIEGLDIQKMASGNIKNINRTYQDVAWAQFAMMLAYKAESAGRKFVKVNPSNTSKMCSKCGKINELPLKKRTLSCSCGHTQDRDMNAASNILALGLQCLSQAQA